MTQIRTLQPSSGPARAALSVRGGAVDRGSLFRRASRHSGLVRILKFGLPVTAVLLLGSYALYMHRTIRFENGSTLHVGTPKFSTENLTMENPRYEGFNKDGSKYVVTAKTAITDMHQREPIKLNAVDGRLLQQNGAVTDLKAVRGLFDNKTHVLELFDGIDVQSNNGMTAQLSRATIYSKESKIVSKEPVVVTMPAGRVRGNEMVLLQKSRDVLFSGGVAVQLAPAAARTSAATGTAAAPAGQRQPNAPVDVTAATLAINDAARIAAFKGNVQAVQKDAVLATEELDVHYDAATNDAGAAPPPGAGKLKRLVAKTEAVMTRNSDRVVASTAEFDAETEMAAFVGNVVMTQGAELRVTADRADIDTRSDKVVLSGAVVTTQGRNSLTGRRLFIDRKAGTGQLTAPAADGQSAGRIAAQFYQSEAAAGRAKKSPVQRSAPDASEATAWVFRSDANAPIDVEADTLDVNDPAKTAVFRGSVRAQQGAFTVSSEELIVTYAGQSGLTGGPSDAAASRQAAQIERIKARKNVVITSLNERSVKGDWADFDVKSNTVTVGTDSGSNVLLRQGKSAVVENPTVTIDLTSGIVRMGAARPAPAQSGTLSEQQTPATPPAPGTGNCGGRMCAVLYPNEVRDAAKRGKAAILGEGATSSERKAAPGESGATDSWSATAVPVPGKSGH